MCKCEIAANPKQNKLQLLLDIPQDTGNTQALFSWPLRTSRKPRCNCTKGSKDTTSAALSIDGTFENYLVLGGQICDPRQDRLSTEHAITDHATTAQEQLGGKSTHRTKHERQSLLSHQKLPHQQSTCTRIAITITTLEVPTFMGKLERPSCNN